MTTSSTRKHIVRDIQKLALLPKRLLPILAWPIVCAFLGILLWSVTLAKLGEEKAALHKDALKDASTLAKAYANQLSRAIGQVDQITLLVKHDWVLSRGTLNLEALVQDGLFPASQLLFVSIANRDGWLVTATSPIKHRTFVADRDYFLFHRREKSSALRIGQVTSGRVTGKTIVQFTRRLETANGSFDGVAIVSAELPYFLSFYERPSMGETGLLAMVGEDGALRASSIGTGSRPPSSPALNAIPTFDTAGGTRMMAGRPWFADHLARFMAWESTKPYPFIAVVGLSEREVFAPYQSMKQNYYRMAIVSSVLLLLLATSGMFYAYRLAWRKQEADKVKRAFRLATDVSREGFYIVRPMYDQHGRIVDFVVEDCNERGAAYYGTTKAKLIGSTFSSYLPGAYASDVITLFARAMETGSYEDEFKVPPESPLRPAWIHRRLLRSDDGLAVTLRDISDLKAEQEALSRLANADPVTTLPNRHWLMNYLPAAVEKARNNNTMLALLFVDLDNFKNINDTLGHAAGDELLRAAGVRLRSVLRPTDNIVRLGGDEFTVILEPVDNFDSVSRVTDRITRALEEPLVLADGSGHVVQASIGISIFPQDADNAETLLKHADIAMYAAKANGRANYQFFEPHLSEKMVLRLNMERALRQALARDEFELYYQPRVSASTGELSSMEALVRWNHPELGLVPPNDFIPIAEETKLIVELGELVIRKTCEQIAQWKAQRLPVVPVSVNVSPRQFNQGSVSAFFASCMAEHGIDAFLVEIEMTESCVIGESPAVTKELAAIEALGMKLLVDDFGTGYSSLSQLQRLDVDGLKVDRAFVGQLGNGKQGEALFMAIVSMAHAIGLHVVAEGVETLEQLRTLQTLSCDEIQGYLISKPIPASEIPPLLVKRFLFPESANQPFRRNADEAEGL